MQAQIVVGTQLLIIIGHFTSCHLIAAVLNGTSKNIAGCIVKVQLKTNYGLEYRAVGVAIDPYVVITPCSVRLPTANVYDITIASNSIYRTSNDGCTLRTAHCEYPIKDTLLCLYVLNTPFSSNTKICAVTTASRYVNETVIAIDFGYGNDGLAPVLQQAKTKIVPKSMCVGAYRSMQLSDNDQTSICAENSKAGACAIDTGTVLLTESFSELVGVVQRPGNCGPTNNVPTQVINNKTIKLYLDKYYAAFGHK